MVYRVTTRIDHIRIGKPVSETLPTACLKEPRPQ